MIEKLTPEQEALIPVYMEKWISLAMSTEPINREKATEAVNAACAVCWNEEPKILVFDSLYSFLKDIDIYFPDWEEYDQIDGLGTLEGQVCDQLYDAARDQLYDQLLDPMHGLLHRLWNPLLNQFFPHPEISHWVASNFAHDVNPQDWLVQCSFIDFCVSVLNCSLDESDRREWDVLQSLVKSCGWIYQFVKDTSEDTSEFVYIVCDRPTKLLCDRQQRLHAEGEPAIQFADGFSMYAYHGVGLPEKYGKLNPHQWQAQWLLQEDNAELRRVLIQGMGYTRICQDLEAIELDTWREYTLLKIDNDIDEEPIYLLKMTCPSTERIHALRVPPDVNSAKEAIRWVNWGTDPEDFAIQT